LHLLQLDWPHDWYQGRNAGTRALKQLMYQDGLRRLRQVPVVWTAHNLRAHDARDAAYEHRMIQALIDVCDGVIALSQASSELLLREYRVPAATQVEVVYHGHYIGCYLNVVSRIEARERLGLPADSRVVLSIGRLQPYKGLEELVEAFGRIAAPGDVLLLAGKTVNRDYADRLRAAIATAANPAPRIELRDALVPDDELQLYFNACDLVALPFRQVLNSGSLLLAMSFGCPVVAPRLGSIPEVACPEGWYPYDADDPDGLATALGQGLAVAGGKGLRDRILGFTAARYDWTESGRRVVSLYRSILDRVAGGTPARMRH
jgi:glycosyltransferase involved in cell wall biosynthesis